MSTTVFRQVGPYEILRQIGQGGMAVVFLANDTRTNRQIALRLVRGGNDPETRDILEAEQWGAQLQEQFSRASPHVPAVYEYGIEGEYFYIAMEYLDGENLSDAIRRGALQADRAVIIAVELCRFLEAAHSFEASIDGRKLLSLLHGDLTPRNVRITSAGHVKVLDFGIAKALSLSRKVTRNDFGSIAYLSPERLESGEMDMYADFWAIGVLLYEMVGGAAPFQAADTRRLEQRIRSRHAPAPLTGRCALGLEAVVAKLLAPHPDERYGSAKAIREDLERFTSGQQTEAEREGWPGRASDEPPTRRTRPAVETVDETTRRTSPGGSKDPPLPEQSDKQFGSLADEAIRGAARIEVPVVQRATPRRRHLLRTVLLVTALVVMNEVWVSLEADRLAGRAATQELAGLTAIWSEYDTLARRSFLAGIGVGGLERALIRHTVDLTERVIGNYRTPRPSVRETQWKAAREALARAVGVTPDNARLKAALRYCDGHLHRINGEARKARSEDVAAQHEFTEAVTAFREAAELRPNWPDPFLGLARTFIYGLEDVSRGSAALDRAQSLGYTLGARETAQLGDGYHARAETMARTARKLTGMPQEQEYLNRAAEAYRLALAYYENALDFSDVAGNVRRAKRGLQQVEQRLAELTQSDGQQGSDAPQGRTSAAQEAPPTTSALIGYTQPWA